MRLKPFVSFAIVLALLPACSLFGINQLEQRPALPTTQMELTLSESAPDSNAPPEYDAVKGKSKDGETVYIDITLLFKIDPNMSDHIQEKWGERYIEDFVTPTLRHTTEAAISIYTGRQIYGEGRLDLINTLQTMLNKNISVEGFVFQDVLVRNITFEASFIATVESEYLLPEATALHEATLTP